jgi:sialic acid synthase
LDLKFIKIGSGDTNNVPMMRYIAKGGREGGPPLIVSTGMQTEDTIKKVYDILNNSQVNFALLHCISSYPTPVEDTQLNYISRYQKLFSNIPIGYSGHENGIECSVLAILMGARILERHFTLDKNQKGSDHCVSLDPSELRALVEKVRLIERNVQQLPVMLVDLLNVVVELNLFDNPQGFITKACQPPIGNNTPKSILPSELMCKHKLGKSLVYSRDISAGQCLIEDDVCVKVSEPNGIPAEFYDNIIGKELKCDVSYDHPVIENDF